MTNVTEIALPRLYDMNMHYIDRIHPSKVGYEIKRNKVSTANMDMEGADQLATVPQVCQFVDLFETYGSIGKFRVESLDIERSAGENQTFYLEHAITTLSDGCVDGYLELGGTGVNTRTVLLALLALQPMMYWTLGDCDFDYQFQHSFENDDLLTAIFSIPASFTDEYIWIYNTDVFPFVLNLKHVQDGDASELRMNRNIQSVKITIDREPLCTRIYPKGYGEGTNQLTIADVNNGLRYLDADTQSTYGIVCKQWPDTTFTDATLLKSVATTVLSRLKEPLVTTVFEAYEIYELTGESLDRFYVGRLVRAPLPAFGTTIRERVVSIAKKDVYFHNEDAMLTLTNKSSDITDDLAELVRKATIGELYSQGAANMYAEHYADNASPKKPLVCKFWVDGACVHINAVILEFTLESFRSYSATSEAGGKSTSTSSAAGNEQVTSEAGGGSVVAAVDTGTYLSGAATIGATALNSAQTTSTDIQENQFHVHTVYGHTHTMANGGLHYHTINHTHQVTIPAHSHTVSVSAHRHSVEIPSHTHKIEHGIYEGGSAASVAIKVDSNAVPASAIVGGSVDLVAYMAKDDNGKITRNVWHRIEITPDALTRIVSDVFVKTFIRSIGGGTY
ncbi:MAG: phage tail spike protein [Clostridia bacterium]